MSRCRPAGVMLGYPPQQCSGGPLQPCFKPDQDARRDDVAVGIENAGQYPLYVPPQQTFADVPPSYPAYKAIETLAHLGIVSGAPCGNFLCYYPTNPIRRDEMSSVIEKAIEARP
jgi:S-layer homology domain